MSASIRCLLELMDNPVGIAEPSPRFSWALENPGDTQTAYRITVSAHEDLSSPVWDTGMRSGACHHLVPYEGLPLSDGTCYYYRIRVTGKKASYLSELQTFCTGILTERDWDSVWIGGAGLRNHSYLIRWPVFIRKPLSAAAVFAASPNYYQLYLDGAPCLDLRLNNAFTDPSKTLLYETYPLSLTPGAHVLGIELGNGWYAMEQAERGVAKGEHLIAAWLRLSYADGEVEWLHTDPETCLCTAQAPSLRNSVYTGETRDARREPADWCSPGFEPDESQGWQHAFWLDPPGGTVRAQQMEPIRIVNELEPAALRFLPDGSVTADFGVNFAGWVRLKLSVPAGTRITLRHAELIHADGTVNECSLNGISAVDTYIAAGREDELFEPHFTYHGFRYVQIFGLPCRLLPSQIRGCVVRSDVARIGAFRCDNDLLNRFYAAAVQTEQSNLHSIPTDCPQRAERMGWMNDMTVRNECALYQFRLPQLYRKWMGDIRDAQGRVTGAICDTAPFYRIGQKPADPVSSSLLLVPWNLYCFYADRTILEENYAACRRWVFYLDRLSEDGLIPYSPMGDWASPSKWCDPDSIGAGSVSRITPGVLVSSCFQYYNWRLMEKMAAVLELGEDASLFASKAAQVKAALLKAYYHEAEGFFAGNSQASNALPLYLDLTEGDAPDELTARILRDLEENDYHLTTGNLCSRFVPEVLFLRGHADEAFRLLTQTTYPSWGYMLENGATTLWERWEKIDSYHGVSRMASYSHPMTGSVTLCFPKYLAGIRPDEHAPGFAHSIIRPLPPRGLRCASASIDTVHGRLSNAWRRSETAFIMETEIPSGCTADLYLPVGGHRREELRLSCAAGGAERPLAENAVELAILPEGTFLRYPVGSGRYRFTLSYVPKAL